MHKALLVLLGLGIGLVGGYFAGRYVEKVKAEEELEDVKNRYESDFREIDEYYAKKYGLYDGRNVDDVAANGVKVHTMDEEYKKPEPHDYTTHYKVEKIKTEEAKGETVDPAELESPSDSDIVIEGYGVVDERELEKDKPAEEIHPNEYGTKIGYKTVDLIYYQGNDTLVCEEYTENEVISSKQLDDMVGDALTKFGFKTNSVECIFVRSYAMMTDYMITKAPGSYRV